MSMGHGGQSQLVNNLFVEKWMMGVRSNGTSSFSAALPLAVHTMTWIQRILMLYGATAT